MTISTPTNMIKERLSLAYVTAVAARAGCQVNVSQLDFQSVDVTVSPVKGAKTRIELQLKATSSARASGEKPVVFPLPKKNYDDLRDTVRALPAYLVVFVLPEDDNDWCNCDQDALVLRRCAYWVSIRGAADSPNTSSVATNLPTSQVFDVTALKQMIQEAYDLNAKGAL
jgi:hypothetical protein